VVFRKWLKSLSQRPHYFIYPKERCKIRGSAICQQNHKKSKGLLANCQQSHKINMGLYFSFQVFQFQMSKKRCKIWWSAICQQNFSICQHFFCQQLFVFFYCRRYPARKQSSPGAFAPGHPSLFFDYPILAPPPSRLVLSPLTGTSRSMLFPGV